MLLHLTFYFPSVFIKVLMHVKGLERKEGQSLQQRELLSPKKKTKNSA